MPARCGHGRSPRLVGLLMRLMIKNAEVDGRRVDVRVEGGRVEAMGERLRLSPDEDVISADGGALLPGLHDHHLHLHAMAARLTSVDCRPADIVDLDTFVHSLRTAARQREPAAGIRVIGYHEEI